MHNSTVIQRASSSDDIPSDSEIDDWICKTLEYTSRFGAQVTVRIIDEAEMEHLNFSYRKKAYPTDVLAFTYPQGGPCESESIGDVAVCASVVNQQAAALNSALKTHWARIMIHGVLHLCGYDHQCSKDALAMETAEREILLKFGLEHPDLVELSV